MKSHSGRVMYWIYTILMGAAILSLVFTNISYDAEYQLAMAYRLIKGDELITEMWEPHQTSAFLCAILMKMYIMITGTTTGIVLYTQVMGLLIRFGFAFWFMKTVKEWVGSKTAIIICVIYLFISPKELLTPEFGNMQVWFSTAMYLFLLEYFKKSNAFCLIGSAVSLCLAVFSYPSALLCYFAAVFALWVYSKKRGRDIFLFTAVCALIGGIFAGYLLYTVGFDTILNCVTCALNLEPSHTVSAWEKLLGHLESIAKVLVIIACACIVGFLIERLIWIARKKKDEFSLNTCLTASWFALLAFLLINILSVENRGGYAIPFLFTIAVGFANRNLLSCEEKRLYYVAMAVGIMDLLATMILSDHVFLQDIAYMLVWICASVVPLYRAYEAIPKKNLKMAVTVGFHLWLILILFRILYIHIPISGRGQICSIADDLGIIRSGPAIGIITDEMGAAKQRDSMEEWSEFVHEGDTIWIIGEPVDTLGYLYEDVEVGAPTVMSTPTYNESLEYYWKLNPDKYPDVVIISSYGDTLEWELLQNRWLMNWLENEYCADTVTHGTFWTYYERRR